MGSVKTPKSPESENSYSESPDEDRMPGVHGRRETGWGRSGGSGKAMGVKTLWKELDPVSVANITEFLFAVIGEVALFARLHLLEVLWAGLVTFWR